MCHSIKGAKGAADERVERSLYLPFSSHHQANG